ncbi:MAG: hypothetical protein IT298_03955 [Chloroflexi bacterium]|jgi:hypothetical protein|nr:hypothetical protein [Chloroflexota bacterium]MBV6437195.1 hypothetical protein [Anaerolineae bacterium]MDL1914891.1 hypothetical protein [Anaerolineae bacterium CFX4]OQY79494.1 MAG: hypothetical protein B6D42_14960 [Anaerolineae bacterium UTCFX5]MBW7879386.1 hypothetical protein [Anaerolineae bacterium]
MSQREIETHAVGLIDLPVVRRLIESCVCLDNEAHFTTEVGSSSLTGILLPSRGVSTLIARGPQAPVIGQIKVRDDEPNAHVIYVAPEPEPAVDDTAWLHVLDALTREAGKMRAHTLVAEVAEDSAMFEVLRTAGFSVYTRQQLWQRRGMYAPMPSRFQLTEETQNDIIGVQGLIAQCVPPLLQPVAMPPSDMPRLVYHKDGCVAGYVAYSTGRRGIYVLSYLHPDTLPDAAHILDAALQMIGPAVKTPITFCVRRYQDWMGGAMERLGFVPGEQQALMVKHLTAGVRTAPFEALVEKLDRVKARPNHSHQARL